MKTEKQNKAIAHITEQMMQDPDHSGIRAVEEHLTDICTTDAVAGKLLDEGKNLKSAFKCIEDYARRHTHNGCAYVEPTEGYRLVDEYYGICEEDKAPVAIADTDTVDILGMI